MKKPKTITNTTAAQILNGQGGADYMITVLAIETGLRISDILKLRRTDISNPLVVVEKKTKRCREIVLSDTVFKMFQNCAGSTDLLFPGRQSRTANKSIHRTTYHRRLKKILTDVSAHSFRKLYAQNKFRETGNIFAVQKLMNHKYVETTAAYLDIDIKSWLGGIKPNDNG